VIGDGNHIESQLLGPRKYLRNTGRAVGGHRMDVQIGSPLHSRYPSLRWAHDGRSSQIG
jgi:hypothetical protein